MHVMLELSGGGGNWKKLSYNLIFWNKYKKYIDTIERNGGSMKSTGSNSDDVNGEIPCTWLHNSFWIFFVVTYRIMYPLIKAYMICRQCKQLPKKTWLAETISDTTNWCSTCTWFNHRITWQDGRKKMMTLTRMMWISCISKWTVVFECYWDDDKYMTKTVDDADAWHVKID
jgi:hypothetical protein